MEKRRETWNSYWGKKLRIEFFEGKWEMYRKVADARAEWLEATFNLDKSRPLLSCACGEGGIELALSRRGFRVTGIDRCAALTHFAREQAAKEELGTTFLTADLREDQPLPGGNGTVVCFDTLGLLASEEEELLLAKMSRALASGGTLLVDGPQREAQTSSRHWWPVGDGYLLMETRWDKGSSTQVIEPLFIEPDGAQVILADPYDQSRGNHTGVHRYVYNQQELLSLVQRAGLPSAPVGHQRQGYFMIVAGAAAQALEAPA